jgi:NAD(P)-dependent dehydrogenase (short-subunit alcohol dehydrogenase family)
MGQTINATIQAGVLTLPDGQSIDLKQVQSALNFGFQETGDHDLMAAGDLMSKITGVVQGPSGEFVPVGDQQVAEMPTKAADLSNVDSFALQCELERRGLLVQTWSPGDFEFIGNEDDDAADLSDDALEQIQQQAFDQCRRSLDEITTQRGNEHLGDWWAINKEPILAQFKTKDEAPSPGM